MTKRHGSYSGVREGTEWLSYRDFPWLAHRKPKARGRSAMEKRIARALRNEQGLRLTKADVEKYGPAFLSQQSEINTLGMRIERLNWALSTIADSLHSTKQRTLETIIAIANEGLLQEREIELEKDKEAGRFDEYRD